MEEGEEGLEEVCAVFFGVWTVFLGGEVLDELGLGGVGEEGEAGDLGEGGLEGGDGGVGGEERLDEVEAVLVGEGVLEVDVGVELEEVCGEGEGGEVGFGFFGVDVFDGGVLVALNFLIN